MQQVDQNELQNLINNETEKFQYEIDPNIISRFQLMLTGKITKGIEVFGIGPMEIIRGLGFMHEYTQEINYAVQNNYRVFVIKHGSYFGSGVWNLEFRKN
jgi:hypothetical protein